MSILCVNISLLSLHITVNNRNLTNCTVQFGVTIIFQNGSYLIAQSYLPGGTNSTRTGGHAGLCRAFPLFFFCFWFRVPKGGKPEKPRTQFHSGAGNDGGLWWCYRASVCAIGITSLSLSDSYNISFILSHSKAPNHQPTDTLSRNLHNRKSQRTDVTRWLDGTTALHTAVQAFI